MIYSHQNKALLARLSPCMRLHLYSFRMTSDPSSSKAISLSYKLYPPTEVNVSQVTINSEPIPTHYTTSIPIESTSTSTSSYYEAASKAVLVAQKEMNDKFTAWKNAIGDTEKSKEDLGKIGYGRGKAARLMNYSAVKPSADQSNSTMADEEESEEEGIDVGES